MGRPRSLVEHERSAHRTVSLRFEPPAPAAGGEPACRNSIMWWIFLSVVAAPIAAGLLCGALFAKRRTATLGEDGPTVSLPSGCTVAGRQ